MLNMTLKYKMIFFCEPRSGKLVCLLYKGTFAYDIYVGQLIDSFNGITEDYNRKKCL